MVFIHLRGGRTKFTSNKKERILHISGINMDAVKKYLTSPFTRTPNKKQSSFGNNLVVLDGIRGLAVLIVVASHTGAFGMRGQGSLGVLLFFFLSGFLLMLPFSTSPEKMINFTTVSRYFLNRTLRIVPLYIIAVFIMSILLHENYTWYLWNISFIKGWNHLWSVAEEMRFYLLLPIVILLLSL